MTIKATNIYGNIFLKAFSIALAMAALALPSRVAAFPVDTYSKSSRLAEGRWVKISVPSTGIYLISNSDLSAWGFSDPSKVRVFGYGGKRLSDVLALSEYIDDLPAVPMEVTNRGIVFYGVGPETWTSNANIFTHTLNPFSSVGYYFLGEGDAAPAIPETGTPSASSPTTTFVDRLFHEQELTKTGETGHQILGEDLKWTNNRSFKFDLTDLCSDKPVTMTARVVAKCLTSRSLLSFTANGTALPKSRTDEISVTPNSSHNHGMMTTTTKEFTLSEQRLELGIAFSCPAPVVSANLDYIELQYTRRLRMSDGKLLFRLNTFQAKLEGTTATTRIWDVTNPLDIKKINASAGRNGSEWTTSFTGLREYAAWDETAPLPSPAFVGKVAPQNLHAADEQPRMVIFCRSDWKAQAERIADLHRRNPDNMTVTVVDPEQVYNEFGSGAPDVNTFRRYLKMLWDRGNASGKPLEYALFIGKPTFDNRRVSDKAKAITYPTLPTWQSDIGLDDNVSFTTDDIFGFLNDGSGERMGSDELCIAVGRIPVRTVDDLRLSVDKLYEYVDKSRHTSWRNQVLFLADDENNGIHMEQSEQMWNGMMGNGAGDRFDYTKVYTDAFEKKNGTYPGARDRMYTRLDEGLLWWNYIGHANPTSWTAEGLLTYKDINNLYIRSYPMLYAATCEFLNWDSADMSGAEILYFTRQGGIIGAITAVRPVYISDNGMLGRALSPKVFETDANGDFLTIGEIYRRGKNNLTDSKGEILNNPNKLRFVLMGDPAMRLASPSNQVILEKINGVEVNEENQPTIMARQRVVLEGRVTDPKGTLLSDFNGEISIDIYDAEHSTTSNGYGEGKRVTFEEKGARIYTGRDTVNAGRFKMSVAMPEAVANNFRPASMNLYACSQSGKDAVGMNREFYVYGYDDTAEPDTVAPSISDMYLNHPSFKDGNAVNSSPMLFARVSDNLGFNLSTQGVGHTLSLQLDGNRTFTDVPQYFTPDMGSLSGTLAYPLADLTPGNHSLRLRVWDTWGNFAESTIDFFVNPDLLPEIYKVYTNVNPASTDVNFLISHNRPDQMMTVKVDVYNMLGQPVWSGSATGRSDSFVSSPLNWNLTDAAGRRVKRGIYIYRASITEQGGEQYVTGSNRLAVTAP